MKLKQRILFIPVFIVLIYGIYTSVVKIKANRQRRAEILAQIRADELKYNQGPGHSDYSTLRDFNSISLSPERKDYHLAPHHQMGSEVQTHIRNQQSNPDLILK